MRKNIKSNIWKLYVGKFLMETLFIAPIIVPFLADLGLTMKEIMLTETVYAAAIMLTEIPSGYFADRVGRKISIVLGVLFWIIGICFYAFTFSFWWICLGALLWGIGSSFNSGADEAMLYETLVEQGREKEYKKASGNLFFYGRMASVAGGIMAGFMAADNIKIPAYATLFMVILWFFLSLTLHETRGEIKDKETWRHFKRVFYESIVVNKTLRYFLIFTAVGGFYGMEFWLNQRYWEFMGIPILYFGILVSGIAVFSGFAGKYASEIEAFVGRKMALIMIPLLPIVTWVIFANVNTMWVIPLFFIGAGMRGFTVPVFNSYIQHHATPDRRATIMSISNMLSRIVFFSFAPFLGAMVDMYSIQTAFLICAGLLAVFTGVSLVLLRKVRVI